eukprot:GHVN01080807.1.p1 GENE.GHVN01080807.1~~GHVN01080807.1.p1  ORF type:complete len:563 (+),score=72.74 GHVN01080807.1:71-1759(+)
MKVVVLVLLLSVTLGVAIGDRDRDHEREGFRDGGRSRGGGRRREDIKCPNADECHFLGELHCGSDGITYENACYFRVAQCKDDELTLAQPRGKGCKPSPPIVTPAAIHGGSEPKTLASGPTHDSTHAGEPLIGTDSSDNPAVASTQTPADIPTNSPTATLGGNEPNILATASARDTQRDESLAHGVDAHSNTSSCDADCPSDFQPYCGSDGVTYTNACHFEIAKCKAPSLTLALSPGTACPTILKTDYRVGGTEAECSRPCNAEEIPYCGSDGVTYGNKCHFLVAQCMKPELLLNRTPGEPCPGRRELQGRRRKCGGPCPLNYVPHCASNGVLYGNSCHFEAARCEEPTLNLVPYKEGEDCGQRANAITATCEKACSGTDFFPHCGSDGHTYGSLCLFEIAQCINPNLQLVLSGGLPCAAAGIGSDPEFDLSEVQNLRTDREDRRDKTKEPRPKKSAGKDGYDDLPDCGIDDEWNESGHTRGGRREPKKRCKRRQDRDQINPTPTEPAGGDGNTTTPTEPPSPVPTTEAADAVSTTEEEVVPLLTTEQPEENDGSTRVPDVP